MIVDEQEQARRLARRAAATPQDTVFECASPDEALTAVEIFRPDCVLMGLRASSPGTLRAIRALRASYPHVRVLALGHHQHSRLQPLAAAAGAMGYVAVENLPQLFLLAAPERLTSQPPRRPGRRRRGGPSATSNRSAQP
jgi:CheY-like chemotaxis protein